MRDVDLGKRVMCFVIIFVLANSFSRAAVYDEAKFIVNHPTGTKRTQNYTKRIPKGEVKQLNASSTAGTNVDSIVSTKLKSDPNGLIQNSTPGQNIVSMTTNDQSSARKYPLTIGGKYRPISTGTGGGGDLPEWEGVAEAKVISGSVDKMERKSKKNIAWYTMKNPGNILVTDKTYSGDEAFRMIINVEPSNISYGILELVIIFNDTELQTIAIKGGNAVYERSVAIFGSNPNGQVYARIRNISTNEVLDEFPFWVGPQIEVSGVSIYLTDGTYKAFGTGKNQDNTFDPFYDDKNIGGRENFSITDGAWDANYVTWDKVKKARDRSHKADVIYTLNKPGTARAVIYASVPGIDIPIQMSNFSSIAGENKKSFWDIDSKTISVIDRAYFTNSHSETSITTSRVNLIFYEELAAYIWPPLVDLEMVYDPGQ